MNKPCMNDMCVMFEMDCGITNCIGYPYKKLFNWKLSDACKTYLTEKPESVHKIIEIINKVKAMYPKEIFRKDVGKGARLALDVLIQEIEKQLDND